MDILNQVKEADSRIKDFIWRTPLELNHILAQDLGFEVFLKLENQQISGSFKARGAFNKFLSITPDSRKRSFFVAASTGNHAAAFCTALLALGLKGKVFMPENVSPSKLEFIKAMGVPYELQGNNSLHTEIYTRKIAEENGYVLIHPYNDRYIVGGQGTVGLEMLEQEPNLDVMVVPVGGGGLIGGIAGYVKSVNPEITIIGCQPAMSPEMVYAIERGSILDEDISQPTLSDGTAGGMEQGSITFELAQTFVDEWALIEEDAIAFEVVQMLEHSQMIIEGAAALSLAFLRMNKERFFGKKVGVVICGKRIAMKTLQQLICDAKAGNKK